MTKILMIRHGEAAASFTDDKDPGLSELGVKQAASVASRLSQHSPIELVSSPLKRAFQTAQALQQLQGGDIRIEQRVSEIPSHGLSITERGPWLRRIMAGPWADLPDELLTWRGDLLQCLVEQPEDCAVFSHFVAINIAVAHAEGAEAMTVFRPDNSSVTELETDGSTLRIVNRGEEAVTLVN